MAKERAGLPFKPEHTQKHPVKWLTVVGVSENEWKGLRGSSLQAGLGERKRKPKQHETARE